MTLKTLKLEKFLNLSRKLIPKPIFKLLRPVYHYLLALFGAFFYGFPSKKIKVIGITGTKGKSTTTYLLSKILEEADYKVGVISSLTQARYHQTMPGRFRIQKALKEFVENGCQYAILEVTSEGIKQFRHRFIDFEVAVFTNLAPEHIESHGSFEKYREAKLDLFRRAKNIHIINADDENASYFINIPAQQKIAYSLKDWPKEIKLKLIGKFNIYNALSALTIAKSQNIDFEIIKRALEKVKMIPGRMEFIDGGQEFKVVIDYAHTPNSLEQVYRALKSKLLCVLGAAGGGRDKWKRPVMGEIASRYCQKIILTNEDPYDDDPNEIIRQIERGLIKTEYFKENYFKILDRRQAIQKAFQLAQKNDIVVITGKGSEKTMMVKDKAIPWNEREIIIDELQKMLKL